MENDGETRGFGNAYWDAIAAESAGRGREELWRAHLRELYRNLKDRWRQAEKPLCTLKTDLYDEAVSTHNLISLFGTESERIVGTDVSLETARAAKRRMADEWGGWSSIAVSDARRQAFKSSVFDEVLSNSTLDHFADKSHILESLEELWRIMKPGGTLIITLDNPWNPVVWVRNRLPYRLLKAAGLVPFYMGATLSGPELVRALEAKGFRVCDSSAIAHGPRILAIWTGRLLARTPHERIRGGFHRVLRMFERLEALPTKYLTGYYVAVKAVKA